MSQCDWSSDVCSSDLDVIAGGSSFADAAAGIGGSFIGGLMNTEFKTGGKKSKEERKRISLTMKGIKQ